MQRIPVLGFAGYSGSGKTTLIEKIIACLTKKDIKVAIIKHDVHGIDMDHKGKDTYRFAQAGVNQVCISGPNKSVMISETEKSLIQQIQEIKDVDIIFVEGYKHAQIPKIGIARAANQKGFTAELSEFIAIVSDLEVDCHIPCFGLNDIEQIVQFIMEESIMNNQNDFTHFNEEGRAKMVDVGEKDITKRTATAFARVIVNEQTYHMIKTGGIKKGDVLTVAQIAGIMGAKQTSSLIPMCHPIPINGVDMSLSLDDATHSVIIKATLSTTGRTGIEMEALSAVSIAALTVYDMCKAVQKDIVITDIKLLEKTGGIHGDFHRKEDI